MIDELEIGLVLDYLVALARQMIVAGANLERVELAVDQTAKTYELKDVGLFLLSTYISISARSDNGIHVARQGTIPPAGIHLERLKRLNRLSYRVVEERPGTERLLPMLSEVTQARTYPDAVILVGQILGMSCLCFLFGGALSDAAAVLIVTVTLHYLLLFFANTGVAHMISNAFVMWVVTTLAILLVHFGIGVSHSIVVITVSMLVIPGIPLVNAMRNILCNHEMNGILQLIKVILETMSLAVGTYISLLQFGGGVSW